MTEGEGGLISGQIRVTSFINAPLYLFFRMAHSFGQDLQQCTAQQALLILQDFLREIQVQKNLTNYLVFLSAFLRNFFLCPDR